MSISKQLARHLREIHFGGNWTESNFKDQLKGIKWQQAIKKTDEFNTIAILTYHSCYYISALIDVMEGNPLTTKDADAFNHPPIQSKKDWDQLLDKCWSNAEKAATLLEQMPDSKLLETFRNEKYGNYFRNILGMIEHMHYHLGQIVLLKKLVT